MRVLGGLALLILALTAAACGDNVGGNNPPEVGAVQLTTAEDTAVTATVTASDPDGDALAIAVASPPENGTAVATGTSLTYTPNADFHGTDQLAIDVSDGTDTVTVTVDVTVTAVNDAPVGGADTLAASEDTARVVPQADLLANDTDVDGDALTITEVGSATNGTVAITGADVTFTPTANFVGNGTFDYTVSDGTETAVVTVTVEVGGTNDAPVAVDDAVTTDEDVALDLADLAANDTDGEGQTLSVTAVANATNGSVALNGTVVTFTPDADFHGTATFEYTVTDGVDSDTGLVTVTVSPVNDAPIAVDDSQTTAEDTALVVDAATLAGNDLDVDLDALSITAVANASNGTVQLAGSTVTFTPAANFTGTASFEYTLSDGSATDTALVTVTVSPVADAPVAVDDTAIVQSGSSIDLAVATLLANDSDADGDALSITAVQNAQNGSVTLGATTVTFTPDAGFVGDAAFEYVVSDGALTDVGRVVVTVTAGPVCGDGTIVSPEECDDGGTAAGDGCSAACTIEPGFTCAGQPSSCTTTCGDGLAAGAEACDDGNGDDTDGCTSRCVAGAVCNVTAIPGADRFAVDPDTGHCYASFDTTATTFAAAQASCVAVGGYLVTITSSGENARVAGVRSLVGNPWIGAQDDANDTDDVFDWVTDEPFTFRAFATGEPDDDVGVGGNGECLHLEPNGLWADTNCNISTFVIGQICEREAVPCGDSVLQPATGEECDDGNTSDGDGCSSQCRNETLFLSEYVEGSSNNKAIEIMNPTASPIDTTGCTLQVFFNGVVTPTNIALTATIGAGDVFVICNPSSGAGLLALCDATSASVNFNGDDGIALVCNGTTLDVFGQIGVDPGTEWGTSGTLESGQDNTLRRKCGFTGDRDGANAFDPAAEWQGFAVDTFAGLGDPTCAP